MALRSTMAALILRLRRLIGDDCPTPLWTDEALQERLDERRRRVRYEPLTAHPSYAPGGAVLYSEFSACQGDWEEGASVVDGDWSAVTDLVADYQGGRWTSPTPRGSSLFVSGWVYDLPGSGADVCEAWAARLKASVDLEADGTGLRRSQQVKHLLEMARRLRERQYITSAKMTRLDTESGRAVAP